MGKLLYLTVMMMLIMLLVTGRVDLACNIDKDLIGFSAKSAFERVSEALKGGGA